MNGSQTSQQILQSACQHLEAGRLQEAETLYRSLLAREPNNVDGLQGLGVIASRAHHYDAAIDLMRRSIELAPNIPTWRTNLAAVLRSAGRLPQSLALLQESARRFPAHVQTFRELGATLGTMGRTPESLAAYEQALRLRAAHPAGPNEPGERTVDANVHVNIGAALATLGQYDAAIAANDKAIALSPEYAIAHMNRGHLFFRLGRLREAFADYEYRWKIAGFTSRWPDYPQPQWNGSPLAGSAILLWHEQGMGDTIQFARYAPLVAQRGGKAIILCQPPLKRFLQTLGPAVQIVTDDDPLPHFGCHIPLLSLPRVFGTERATIPSPEGYLRADPQSEAAWRDRFAREPANARVPAPLRVGLVWAGAPGHLDDRNRSAPLEALRPILSVPGVRFYSLQKGDAARQLVQVPRPAPVADLGPDLKDFADTAGLLANLDLLISVDTAVIHAAGALAKESWALLSFESDFRWLCDRERSGWYSSVRLFRQPRPGDWPALAAQVAMELRGRVGVHVKPSAEPAMLSSAGPSAAEGVRASAALLRDAGRLVDAAAALRQAIAAAPEDALLRRDLGLVLKLSGDSGGAVAEYEEAIRLRSARRSHDEGLNDRGVDADLHLNLGVALSELGRHEQALAETDKAIELQPDNALAHLNRVSMRFRRGDLVGGFADYEWRWRDGRTRAPDFRPPGWDGSDLNGRTILLWHEQGFGDTIQFLRYAPLVAARGGSVIVRCQPELVRLAKTVDGVEQVVAAGDPLPAFDAHAALMSLPFLFKTTLETIPAPRHYLAADPDAAAEWRDRLAHDVPAAPGVVLQRIGIVWAGSLLHLNDRNRSLSVEALVPLAAVAGVQYYSLQKGAAGAQLKQALGDRIIDHTALLRDFSDTAALIANLDLVITVDTAVAHLAGALGKPVWMMLPAEPEFRWLFERRESRWYPSMRIYRQDRAGDWAAVVREIAHDLRTLGGNSDPAPADPALEAVLQEALEHHAAGRIQPAEAGYRQVLAARPQHPVALHHLGLIAFQSGQVRQALELMNRAIALDATNPFFLKNLASVCRAAGETAASAQWLRKAIELSPPSALLQEELGVTLERLDRLDESVAAYRQAVELLERGPAPAGLEDPGRRQMFEARLQSNLGTSLERQNRYDEAMVHFERAIAIRPDYALARLHRATILFRRRNLPAAYAEYEYRFRTKNFPTPWPNYSQPLWDGSDPAGRTILLWPEQGLGDVIQYARFAPIIARRGASVVLQCMPPLKRLLGTLGEGIRVVSTDEPLPRFDFHLPLISVPRVLGTTYETLPSPRRYLSADARQAAEWGRRLRITEPGLRVGLVWTGSPQFPANHRRSIPFQDLLPLLRIEGIRFFSLQMGEAAGLLQKASPPYPIEDLSGSIEDFTDSAGIFENLDLLISTDTAIVHLAGAMGKEAWVPLWIERDYRWLMDDQRMPWYPAVRPFLQSQAGKWDDVARRIEAELRQRVGRTVGGE